MKTQSSGAAGRRPFPFILEQTLVQSAAVLAACAASAAAQGTEQKVLALGGDSIDHFGNCVVIEGDLALVGAPYDDHSNKFEPGSVRVFQRGASQWQEVAMLIASPPKNYEELGWSVAVSGNRIVAGAPGSDDMAVDGGAADVYAKLPGGIWEHEQRLVAPNGVASDAFGTAVAIDGNTAFVGAPGREQGAQFDAGAVYVFDWDAPTESWTFIQMLTASTPQYSGELGFSLAVCGDWLLVGSPGADLYGGNAGAVYVFERGPSGWVQHQVLKSPNPGILDSFGYDVACDGDWVIGGAPHENVYDTDSGAAYLFLRTGSAWELNARLVPFDGAYLDQFGARVGITMDLVAVGAPRHNAAVGWDQGCAYLYDRSPWGWVETALLVASDPDEYDEYGFGVAVSATCVLSGAHQDDDQGDNSGSAYFVEQLEDFLDTTPYCFCPDAEAPCSNGDPLAGCANVTGEGARLLDAGSTRVSADDLVLTCENLPALQHGMIYMGGGAAQIPFGAGVRCVVSGGAGIYRFPVRNSGASGTLSEGPGIVDWSQTHFPAAGWIGAGDTWYFQVWYRDALGPCGGSVSFNFSSAVAVEFAP